MELLHSGLDVAVVIVVVSVATDCFSFAFLLSSWALCDDAVDQDAFIITV